MSMCGEVENLQHQIRQKKIELKSLQRRLKDLEKIIDDDRQLKFDMHEVPIGYQEQERYHEWIRRKLREERENNLE